MKLICEMKQAYKKVNNEFFRARSRYIKYYEKLPIDPNCVLLESQHGREISGNIFYIAQYMSQNEKYNQFKIYIPTWIRHKKKIEDILQKHNLENIHLVIYASDDYFKILASAKYLINDNTFDPCFIKKEGQVYLNTWHGTPLKYLGRLMNSDAHSIGNTQKNFIVSDYILFPNAQTRNALMKDYMVENLSHTGEIYAGYPRNSIFFSPENREKLRVDLELAKTKIYAYMPTFRGTASVGSTQKNDAYLRYYLYELERLLDEDEILFVNLHPVSRKNIDFKQFKKIKEFPEGIETYEFLNLADCLITDYSSVFFDFANTRKKIVLFPYDREDYLKDRGMYMELDELPFPKVYDIPSLLDELRSPVNYKDEDFLKRYCKYENQNSAKRLCDFFFFGEKSDLVINENQPNKKENVIIYAGNLAGNGITASLKNLLNLVDLENRNYFIAFKASNVSRYKENLKSFSPKANYISLLGDMNLTITERIVRKLFKKGLIHAQLYMRLMGNRIKQEWKRSVGTELFSTAIQFNGYESEVILMWSEFSGNKIIYVHSDMVQEIKIRKNQRKDVIEYAYSKFNKVAVVTEDIAHSISHFSVSPDKITVCHNLIDYNSVLEKSKEEIQFDPNTLLSKYESDALNFLNKTEPKFITIGRFSPEKGHLRLIDAFAKVSKTYNECRLVIVGGSSNGDYYNLILKKVIDMGMEDKVLLIQNISNPFPILKACDYFVLSSYYEGFGLVIAEADILNKPIISTDIDGPRGFIKKNAGRLVENSENGIYLGMIDLLNNKVEPMKVDYEEYNYTAIKEFESLF